MQIQPFSDQNCKCEHCDLRDMFFGHVKDDLLAEVCTARSENSYSKGDMIIAEGDEIVDFFYLKDGLVKLFRTDKRDRSQIIAIGKPLDFVSLLSVFSDTRYKYSVSAIEDSTTCSLPMKIVTEVAKNNGSFALSVMNKMSQISDAIIMDSLEIRKKQLKGRVAHVLLQFARSIYKSDTYELPISRKEIGEYIGMTTENVIRTLSEFRKDGMINIFGKSIGIIDKHRLSMIADHG